MYASENSTLECTGSIVQVPRDSAVVATRSPLWSRCSSGHEFITAGRGGSGPPVRAPSRRPCTAPVWREAARQGRTMSELVETALRLLFRAQRTRSALPPLPTFNSGGALVDVAD